MISTLLTVNITSKKMLGNNNQNHWLKQLNLFLMDFNMVADQQPYVLSHIQLLPTPDRKTNYSEKKKKNIFSKYCKYLCAKQVYCLPHHSHNHG